MSTTETITTEQVSHYYDVMPELAAGHAAGGPFNLLDTDPFRYPAQLPDKNFLETISPRNARQDLGQLAALASILVVNIEELITEAEATCAQLVDDISQLKYGEGKNVLFVGNHPSVDSIIHPDLVLANAARNLCRANDQPDKRSIIMAKQLAWYGFGEAAGVDLVLNFSNVALTAPGTIKGKKVDPEVRDHINGTAMDALDQRLADGETEVTLAYGGQTDRLVHRHVFTDEPWFRAQFSASPGTKSLLTRPDVVVVPFATYRDSTTKRMAMAFAEPRAVLDTDAADDIGYEIAAMAQDLSGLSTMQVPNKDDFIKLVERKSFADLRRIFSLNRHKKEWIRNDSEHGVYVLGKSAKS